MVVNMNLEELKTKKETLEMQVEKIKQELADKEKQIQIEELKPKRWKPDIEYGRYYFIDTLTDNCICQYYWGDDDADQYLCSIGNCFETREEAEFALIQLKVLAELKEYADDYMEWDGNNKHYLIHYNTKIDDIDICWFFNNKYVPFNIYFSSEEQARKAVEAIGKDRLKKYYFCV